MPIFQKSNFPIRSIKNFDRSRFSIGFDRSITTLVGTPHHLGHLFLFHLATNTRFLSANIVPRTPECRHVQSHTRVFARICNSCLRAISKHGDVVKCVRPSRRQARAAGLSEQQCCRVLRVVKTQRANQKSAIANEHLIWLAWPLTSTCRTYWSACRSGSRPARRPSATPTVPSFVANCHPD
jgi:hypothetical protein